MFNLDQFVVDYIIHRQISMFVADIEANKDVLSQEIKNKKVCVIGGTGSIGSSFIKSIPGFEPKSISLLK